MLTWRLQQVSGTWRLSGRFPTTVTKRAITLRRGYDLSAFSAIADEAALEAVRDLLNHYLWLAEVRLVGRELRLRLPDWQNQPQAYRQADRMMRQVRLSAGLADIQCLTPLPGPIDLRKPAAIHA